MSSRTPFAALSADPGRRPPTPAIPSARRRDAKPWRDPRVAIGLVLVFGSVLLGARVLATSDDTVPVWAVAEPVAAGAGIPASALVRREVRFTDEATAASYLPADSPLPTGAVLARSVEVGELLPRAAVTLDDGPEVVEVPMPVSGGLLPASVRAGSRVDVWVTPPATASGGVAQAEVVLSDVVVVSVPRSTSALGPDPVTTVVLAVPTDESDGLGNALAAVTNGTVTLVKVG